MFNVVSMDTMKAVRRQGTVEEKIPFRLGNKEFFAKKQIVNGEMHTLVFAKPVGEMITTAAGRKEMLEKVVLDVELGREQVPTLYQPIYQRMEDRNFPEVFDAKWILQGVVVFLEHIEGEEIKFGHIQAEQGPIARIVTYAAGFEYTEDMVEYNKSFEMDTLDRSFGEGYNALLNHIHFSPIMNFNYAADNKTAAQGEESDPLTLKVKKTIVRAQEDAAIKKRPGNVLLASGVRKYDIENAMKEMQISGTSHASISGIDTIIYYDGWSVQVGKKEYTYPGVDPNKAYLIRPKRGFRELIKHDLRIDADNADISRLVEAQVVGRARRGVFAAPAQNVQEITLPARS